MVEARFKCYDFADILLRDVPRRTYEQLTETFPSYLHEGATKEVPEESLEIEFVPDLPMPDNARYMKSIAYTDTSYYLLNRHGPLIRIDLPHSGDARRYQVSSHIDVALLEEFIENLLHSRAIRRRTAFVHSGAVAANGEGIVLCAWKGTGKTGAVVEFLRRGYAFIGDDWSIVRADGTVLGYDKSIAMYARDVAGAPEVAELQYGRFKGRMLARYLALRKPQAPHLGVRKRVVRRLLRAAVGRMGLKTSMHVPASKIGSAGTLASAPLRIVYLMVRANVHDVTITKLETATLISQILANYRYEMRSLLDPEQLRFAFPMEDIDLGLGVFSEAMGEVLSQALSRPQVKTFAVEIPVRSDSRELVSRLEPHIHQVLRQ